MRKNKTKKRINSPTYSKIIKNRRFAQKGGHLKSELWANFSEYASNEFNENAKSFGK